MINRRKVISGLSCLVFCLSCIGTADAQTDWPTKPVTIITPYAAGGITDMTVRVIGNGLESRLKGTVLVENLPGAGGVIGIKTASEAPADGYTIALVSTFTNAIVEGKAAKPPYDSLADFDYLTQISTSPLVLVANPSIPAKNLKEFIDYARANPGKLKAAVVTDGSSHLSVADLNEREGLAIRSVPYAGSAALTLAVISNEVDIGFFGVDTIKPFVNDGTMVAFAVASPERVAAFPDLPTFTEAGIEGFNVEWWTGLAVPDGTPQPIIDKLTASIHEVLNDPAVKAQFESVGITIATSTPDEFTAFVRSEAERWSKVMKAAKMGGH